MSRYVNPRSGGLGCCGILAFGLLAMPVVLFVSPVLFGSCSCSSSPPLSFENRASRNKRKDREREIRQAEHIAKLAKLAEREDERDRDGEPKP